MREHEAFTSHIFVPRGHHEALTTGARTQSDILSTDRDHYSRTLSVFLRRSLVVGVHPSRLLHSALCIFLPSTLSFETGDHGSQHSIRRGGAVTAELIAAHAKPGKLSLRVIKIS